VWQHFVGSTLPTLQGLQPLHHLFLHRRSNSVQHLPRKRLKSGQRCQIVLPRLHGCPVSGLDAVYRMVVLRSSVSTGCRVLGVARVARSRVAEGSRLTVEQQHHRLRRSPAVGTGLQPRHLSKRWGLQRHGVSTPTPTLPPTAPAVSTPTRLWCGAGAWRGRRRAGVHAQRARGCVGQFRRGANRTRHDQLLGHLGGHTTRFSSRTVPVHGTGVQVRHHTRHRRRDGSAPITRTVDVWHVRAGPWCDTTHNTHTSTYTRATA